MKLIGTISGEHAELEIPEEAFLIPAGVMCAAKWAKSVGIDPRTRRLWTERNWLEVEYIAGLPYVTREKVLKFLKRVKAGEFRELNTTDTKKAA